MPKKIGINAIFFSILLILILFSNTAQAQQIPLVNGWNLISLGYHTSPISYESLQVTDGATTMNLEEAGHAGWVYPHIWWYDNAAGGYKIIPYYDSNLYWYKGYWVLSGKDNLSLVIPDSQVPTGNECTIPLPKTGYHLIGTGVLDPILWQSCLVTDGLTTKTIQQANQDGWMYSYCYWYDTASGYKITPDTDPYLNSKRGYWVLTGVDNLSLIVTKGEPPLITSITPTNTTTFYTQDIINISVTAQSNIPLEYKYQSNGQILQDWTSSSTYNWQTNQTNKGINNITVYIRDGYQREISKETEIYLYIKPIGPPD